MEKNTKVNPEILCIFLMVLLISSCGGQKETKRATDTFENKENNTELSIYKNAIFPQIHSHLDGMVGEFVRVMHQDKTGNYWFGTNGNGIIRYDGDTLQKMSIEGVSNWLSVRKIMEDKSGNIWFGTSSGLIKFDGNQFIVFSEREGLQNGEIWGLAIDGDGLIWVGTTGGVNHFDGTKFTSFELPDLKVESPMNMISEKLVLDIVEDRYGVIWLVTDGNGIFQYHHGDFTHLTKNNGLTDNNVADILVDRQGNVWIGTFYGGVSKFDGATFTNFTKEGKIDGIEVYNFCEDSKGNVWFSSENFGVYRFDGNNFTQFTTENGLTTNSVQSIYEDKKGQLWFGTWQGISIFDGQKFVDSKDREPWTR